jgi:hypothetical protein
MHYSPVRHSPPIKTEVFTVLPFDLHVLGMPPAFNLSQDQTLHFFVQSRLTQIMIAHNLSARLLILITIKISSNSPHIGFAKRPHTLLTAYLIC